MLLHIDFLPIAGRIAQMCLVIDQHAAAAAAVVIIGVDAATLFDALSLTIDTIIRPFATILIGAHGIGIDTFAISHQQQGGSGWWFRCDRLLRIIFGSRYGCDCCGSRFHISRLTVSIIISTIVIISDGRVGEWVSVGKRQSVCELERKEEKNRE